jgi:hypothetical protein
MRLKLNQNLIVTLKPQKTQGVVNTQRRSMRKIFQIQGEWLLKQQADPYPILENKKIKYLIR